MKTHQMAKQWMKKNLALIISAERAHKVNKIVDSEGQKKQISALSHHKELHFATTHILFVRVSACPDLITYYLYYLEPSLYFSSLDCEVLPTVPNHRVVMNQ